MFQERVNYIYFMYTDVMEVAGGSHYHVINKRSTVGASGTRRHMTATDYLISAHLNAQQHYRSKRLMSVQKHQRTARRISSTFAVMTSLPYSRSSNKLSRDDTICGEVIATIIIYCSMKIGNHMNSSAIWEIIALSHCMYIYKK